MKNKNFKIFMFIKMLILLLLFYGTVCYENAHGKRLYILIGIVSTYFFIGILRKFFIKKELLFKLSFILEILLIYGLENYSRFLINYFFHSFYIVIIIEASLLLKRKESLSVGILTVITAFIKYGLLLHYQSNFSNLSQMVFFVLLNIFILVIIHFAKYYKEEKDKKDELYKELLKAHKKQKEYAERVEKLAVIEERNRIARDIHDTLGHSMTGVIMQIEMADHMADKDMDALRKLLQNAKNSAREGLLRIREVVETLKPDENISKGILSFKELIDKFKEISGVSVELEIAGEGNDLKPITNSALYRTIQESLTNAVRHGKATKIMVMLKYSSERIDFKIEDNGVGKSVINKGFGLKGIEERAANLGGKVNFSSNQGFIVEGYIPLEVTRND